MTDLSTTLDEVVRKTISAVETVAPKAWQLLVEEQRLDGAITAGQCVGLSLLAAVVFAVVWRRTASMPNERTFGSITVSNEAKWLPRIIIGVIALATLTVSLARCPVAIAQFLSPEPFAARALIDGARK